MGDIPGGGGFSGLSGANTSSQSIAITCDGKRASQLRLAVKVATELSLTRADAKATINELRSSILDNWDECADLAELTQPQRDMLLHRQFLHPYIDCDAA